MLEKVVLDFSVDSKGLRLGKRDYTPRKVFEVYSALTNGYSKIIEDDRTTIRYQAGIEPEPQMLAFLDGLLPSYNPNHNRTSSTSAGGAFYYITTEKGRVEFTDELRAKIITEAKLRRVVLKRLPQTNGLNLPIIHRMVSVSETTYDQNARKLYFKVYMNSVDEEERALVHFRAKKF
ncbi:hypothetical protein J4444_01160 [Candidatus Woesearchaeota archaeon]|nr:hypothetical protein [Candidatus Woesearchaeota archaeon]